MPQAGPNVFVSRNVDLPEGASISDLDRYRPVMENDFKVVGIRRSDSDDRDDPHKALGNIVLDDFLDTPPSKVIHQ